jgi:hypothetical protein
VHLERVEERTGFPDILALNCVHRMSLSEELLANFLL